MWVGKHALYTPVMTYKRVLPVDVPKVGGPPVIMAGQPLWLRLARKTV